MKDYMTIYKEWLENPYFDEATKEELSTKSNLPPSAVVSLTQRSHIYRLNETYELVK